MWRTSDLNPRFLSGAPASRLTRSTASLASSSETEWPPIRRQLLPVVGEFMVSLAFASLRPVCVSQVTFRIGDLTNPILKPWAIEKMREQNELAAAGKRAFEARASCQPGVVPGYLVMGRVNPLYFVQGENEVVMINEGGPEVRRVYLNVPHSAKPKISPYGESVGYYEGGDTLVIDTIGLSDNTYIDNYRTPHTTQLHVVERFQ